MYLEYAVAEEKRGKLHDVLINDLLSELFITALAIVWIRHDDVNSVISDICSIACVPALGGISRIFQLFRANQGGIQKIRSLLSPDLLAQEYSEQDC
jgi:hypothetical protein